MENKKIIAGTYEIIGEIGSGGGGVIYLAEHLRLNKKVVLKADKRSIKTDIPKLRGEVDALKNLSHSFIPKVYDFIIEDNSVYTVMDYIDGDSLDKHIKRNEKFASADIVKWACQILDALVYLHNIPPNGILHADIKPANIMLTKSGDISLIDFNIALVLGEEGAVAVGRSFGYASPEHYGELYVTKSKGNVDITKVFTNKTIAKSTTIFDEVEIENKTELLHKIDILSETDIETDILNKTEKLSESDIDRETEVAIEDKTDVLQKTTNYKSQYQNTSEKSHSTNSSSSQSKKIVLDTRSDIYGLGATLYHLVSGRKPNRKAEKIDYLTNVDYPKAIVNIINKAINPNIELRYQSAQEMLDDFKNLSKKDVRSKRFRACCGFLVVCNILTYAVGGSTAYVGLRQMEQLQKANALVEYAQNELVSGDIDSAIELALQAMSIDNDVFMPEDLSKAQMVLTDALGVYDLSNGYKEYKQIELNSSPFFMEISPNNEKIAVIYAYELAVIDVNTGDILKTLKTEQSALCQVIFIDDNTLVYSAENGVEIYDLEQDNVIFKGEPATGISVSKEKKTLACIYKEDTFANIYNIESGELTKTIDFDGKKQSVVVNDIFANPNNNIFYLSEDGAYLATSFADGSLWCYHTYLEDYDIEIFDETSGFSHFEGGIFEDYFAFSATNSEGSTFAVIDIVNLWQTGGFSSYSHFGVEILDDGIYINTDNLLVKIDPESGEQIPKITTNEDVENFDLLGDYTVVTTGKNILIFDVSASLVDYYEQTSNIDFIEMSDKLLVTASMDSPLIDIFRYQDIEAKNLFTYTLDNMYDEVRISADYQNIMMFSYNEFAVFDINCEKICTVEIENAEYVYDQQFKRDEKGSYLQIIYNDGKIIEYSAINGEIIDEKQENAPDLTLYEEFFTEKYRIEAPLHGTAKVYDLETNEFITELEKDAYLTYVTEVGEYIITEYVTIADGRYGLLHDENMNVLAKLPNLTDIIDGKLIFNYKGYLRESKIYSKEEILEMAK